MFQVILIPFFLGLEGPSKTSFRPFGPRDHLGAVGVAKKIAKKPPFGKDNGSVKFFCNDESDSVNNEKID